MRCLHRSRCCRPAPGRPPPSHWKAHSAGPSWDKIGCLGHARTGDAPAGAEAVRTPKPKGAVSTTRPKYRECCVGDQARVCPPYLPVAATLVRHIECMCTQGIPYSSCPGASPVVCPRVRSASALPPATRQSSSHGTKAHDRQRSQCPGARNTSNRNGTGSWSASRAQIAAEGVHNDYGVPDQGWRSRCSAQLV